MSLDPIEYRPWKGERAESSNRFKVIASKVFRQKMESKWVLGLLIIGTFLTFGFSIIFNSIIPHDELTPESMASQMGDGLFFIFIIILVSMICSDLISEDLRSNSLVLYLSRALKPEGYILGKALGALMALSIFTFLPPMILAIATTATQSGGDYIASTSVIAQTLIASAWSTIFMVPIGLMISSLTPRKTYAAVGTFMTFFLLMLIGGILSSFDQNWSLIDPTFVLSRSYEVIFGLDMMSGINGGLLALAIGMMLVPPSLFVYWRIMAKGVGK